MKILLLGSGGREHAIAHFLSKSKKCDKLYVAPGNGGTAAFAENLPDLDIVNPKTVADYAVGHGIDMVVIGPEAPLVAGVADAVREAGIACFGPGAQGAQLEGSKEFSKRFMTKHNLPTAAYASFSDESKALEYLQKQSAPIVVKADGLAAGKGVTVAFTTKEAQDAVCDCFDGRFGEAGATVVVEEAMSGPECSILAFTDGETLLCMEPAQDHKRAWEGDEGPNTGGMGVYSPVPIVTEKEHVEMIDIMQRTLGGLKEDGIDYRGCIYGGFMLTPQGPKLLEFNARFGDPETQVVLPRLKNDLLEVMYACATKQLNDISLEWDDRYAVGVVLASKGYPAAYDKGFEITGLDCVDASDDAWVFHAGTKLESNVGGNNGKVLTNGGRVLCVTALGDSFEQARNKAYEFCDKIDFENKFLRRDIGARALKGRSAWQ